MNHWGSNAPTPLGYSESDTCRLAWGPGDNDPQRLPPGVAAAKREGLQLPEGPAFQMGGRPRLRDPKPLAKDGSFTVTTGLQHILLLKYIQPWLVWLSGLSAGLRTKGSPVQFPVRAHAWVVSQVPSRGRARCNHTLMFLSLSSPSFPLSLKINK